MARMRRSAGNPVAADQSDEKRVETAAVRLLARREHSTEELRRKLVSKGHDAGLVASVIEKLAAKRLVLDDRYAGSLVRHHVGRGQGPMRIRAELRQQGIADAMIEQEFDNAAVDWNRLAVQVRQRKFGATLPDSLGERAKQARFLQYRGFSADQIRAALAADRSDDPTEEWPD